MVVFVGRASLICSLFYKSTISTPFLEGCKKFYSIIYAFTKAFTAVLYDSFTFSALAGILVWALCALGAIFARRAGTLVNVDVAKIPSKA